MARFAARADTPESVHGLSALSLIWNQWEEAFDEFGADIEEYIDAGACVATVTRWRAKGKESGLALDLRTVDVYELANEKVVRVTMGYTDKTAALKAAGLEE